MDIVQDFLEKQPASNKAKVSLFFQEREAIITRIAYETITNLNALELKKFWKIILDEFHQRFIYDYNLVDWERLIKLIRKNILDSQADAVVDGLLLSRLNKRLGSEDKIDRFFIEGNSDIPFGCEAINLRSNLNGERKKSKKASSIRDQDYLYYGILDFVSKVDKNKTKLLLKENYPKWAASLVTKATQRSSDVNVEDTAYRFIKDTLFGASGTETKKKEKEAKNKLTKEDDSYKLKKKCLELIKLQRHQVKDSIAGENERTFIINYFSKIMTTACDLKKNAWKLKWGESKLAAFKEEENLAKNDNENRAIGSSIDAIIASKEFDLEFFLLEVSGPMHREDYDHFLKDRLKIAKNLKYIFKSILRQKLVVSDATSIKLYGVQLYRNTVYVYTLLMPMINIFCFVEALSFKIPTSQATYLKDTPRYIKNIFKMLSFVDNGYIGLKEYMTMHAYYDSDESYSDKDGNLTPPYISPQKNSRKRKEKASSSKPSTSGKKQRD